MAGVSRALDALGRITLPMEIRKSLSIPEGAFLDIHVEGNRIILEKTTTNCSICGSEEQVMIIGDKGICKNCVDFIKEKM
ncbi:MAG: AbrB/MazE/SpoVT family DNA-binding domain-containing protein [Clostridia bacterium]|nr:AbrB/MazE/SpoVT family DNA-binding domain-containing protein [Clostridia bacterium]